MPDLNESAEAQTLSDLSEHEIRQRLDLLIEAGKTREMTDEELRTIALCARILRRRNAGPPKQKKGKAEKPTLESLL